MIPPTPVPPLLQADLSYLQPQDISRLMACLVALGGEVFLLKAEVQQLRLALQARGALAPAELEEIGATDAFKAWLETENKAFARTLLEPFGSPRRAGTAATE
jgi:hypothetical protein